MARQTGLLAVSLILAAAAVLFFLAATGGILFGGASDPSDLGVYAVTSTLLGFAAGAYVLRMARLRNERGTL